MFKHYSYADDPFLFYRRAVPTSSTPTPTTTPTVGRKCMLYSNGCRDTLSRMAFCCGWIWIDILKETTRDEKRKKMLIGILTSSGRRDFFLDSLTFLDFLLH